MPTSPTAIFLSAGSGPSPPAPGNKHTDGCRSVNGRLFVSGTVSQLDTWRVRPPCKMELLAGTISL